MRPGRNDPCWCTSGRKYKKCHLDADESSSSDRQRFRGELVDAIRSPGCMHPHAPSGCSNRSRAHTISRAAALSALAENGHVVELAPDLAQLVRDAPKGDVRLVGINE